MKEIIKEILYNYRLRCDMDYSEVKDNFHTQEEYEIVLKSLNKEYVEKIESLIATTRQETKKEIEGLIPERIKIKDEGCTIKIVFGKTTVGDIDDMCAKNRDIGFNQAIDDISQRIKGL